MELAPAAPERNTTETADAPPEIPYAELVDRAFVLADEGKLAEAAGQLERAAHLRADDADVHYGLGVVYGRRAIEGMAHEKGPLFRDLTGHAIFIDRAIFAYERAIVEDPRHLPALSNLAALYALKGDRDRAIATLKRSLHTDPDQPDLRLRLEELGAF